LLVGVALQGLALSCVAFAHSMASLAVLVVVFGFSQILVVIVAMSLRQERTPDQMLGRVSATILTGSLAMRALGGVSSTALASQLSAQTVFVIIGFVALVVFGVGWLTPLGERELAAPVASADHFRTKK
jgi:MFS family permease